MKFAVFAARVNRGRQIGEEFSVESTASETGIEFFRIDAREVGAKAAGDHFLCEKARITAPKRKNRRHATFCEIFFAIFADVLQKQIAEDYVRDIFSPRLRHCFGHGAFVNLVGARRRNRNLHERETSRGSLCFEKRLANGVHGDAAMSSINGREQRRNLELGVLARNMQGPGAVFPAAPSEPGFRFRLIGCATEFGHEIHSG